ncbi:ATP-grasp domain-containing protein [Zavarzinella formosa]|uniref:ATP-grasp domain-containing protein n=1 Tax=Zavarzinella formosa TaxID=360055 RepID=UPI00035DC268|nr:ATP-grasp domain-containing protein [Zavarzinella formosa]
MTFTLPPIQAPTDEEVKQWTTAKWKAQESALLSGLHPAIMAITIPTMFFAIPMQEVKEKWLPVFDGKNDGEACTRQVECGRRALAEFPDGVFFKLDSRSPKDSDIGKYTAENLDQLPNAFFGSERVFDDICLQRHHRDRIVLCFRKWVEFGEEYRVFVKERQIQGISRYDYLSASKVEHTPEVVAAVQGQAEGYLATINEHYPPSDYVFDIGHTPDGPVMIEINPYGLSDPCLFGSYANIRGFVA